MRTRFNRNCIASSRGNYVANSHKDYLKELHNKPSAIVMTALSTKTKKYYVRCFGTLHEITASDARRLDKSLVITMEV